MTKKAKVPEHFDRHLAHIRYWFTGFEAAGKKVPACIDTLRQIQNWLSEHAKD